MIAAAVPFILAAAYAAAIAAAVPLTLAAAVAADATAVTTNQNLFRRPPSEGRAVSG